MKRFKNTMRFIGDMAEGIAENEKKVKELTDKLMYHSFGLDREQAEKAARVLVSNATVTWKR